MKRVSGACVACLMMTSSAMAEPEANTETRSQSLLKDAAGLLAIGGVTLGVSLGLAYRANEVSNEIQSYQWSSEPWPADIEMKEIQGQRLERLCTITGVLGGAFVATGLLFYWRGRVARSEETRVTVAPTATASSAGVALSGRF